MFGAVENCSCKIKIADEFKIAAEPDEIAQLFDVLRDRLIVMATVVEA